MRVVVIGAGNVATHLSVAIASLADMEIIQVYSHTEIHAQVLATRLQCDYTADLSHIRNDISVCFERSGIGICNLFDSFQ